MHRARSHTSGNPTVLLVLAKDLPMSRQPVGLILKLCSGSVGNRCCLCSSPVQSKSISIIATAGSSLPVCYGRGGCAARIPPGAVWHMRRLFLCKDWMSAAGRWDVVVSAKKSSLLVSLGTLGVLGRTLREFSNIHVIMFNNFSLMAFLNWKKERLLGRVIWK